MWPTAGPAAGSSPKICRAIWDAVCASPWRRELHWSPNTLSDPGAIREGMSEWPLHVRPASADDEEMLFRWRNDPWVVNQGASQRIVSKEEHRSWFQVTLQR